MPGNIPHDDDATVVADRLHQIGRQVRQVSRASTDEGDHITFGQIRALRQLQRCDHPVRMSELADRLGIARRSATSVVDELESAGLAERVPDPNDRRAVLVGLTTAGSEALQIALERRRASAATVLAPLDDHELAQLRQLLSSVVDGACHTSS